LPYDAAVEQTAALSRRKLEILLRRADTPFVQTVSITLEGNCEDKSRNQLDYFGAYVMRTDIDQQEIRGIMLVGVDVRLDTVGNQGPDCFLVTRSVECTP
jgi:hypothetical protein